ncbi:MAG: hypothetical protein ACREX3_18570 [Gammaproteobacteria bacterium]
MEFPTEPRRGTLVEVQNVVIVAWEAKLPIEPSSCWIRDNRRDGGSRC